MIRFEWRKIQLLLNLNPTPSVEISITRVGSPKTMTYHNTPNVTSIFGEVLSFLHFISSTKCYFLRFSETRNEVTESECNLPADRFGENRRDFAIVSNLGSDSELAPAGKERNILNSKKKGRHRNASKIMPILPSHVFIFNFHEWTFLIKRR